MPSVNHRFIEGHLGHRWLDINLLRSWPGHSSDIRADARRRGLEVRRDGKLALFFRKNVCIGSQREMVTSLTASTALRIAKDKSLTKEILKRVDVPTPGGLSFHASQLTEAAQLVETEKASWVVKPSDARAGKGITTGVHTRDQLEAAWRTAAGERSQQGSPILLEEQVDGVDLRVFVVLGRAIAAAVRVPAFLVGDGESPAAGLLTVLKESRRQNAYLRSKSVYVDPSFLARQNIRSLEDVPAADSVVLLNGTANIHRGGVSVDVTELVSREILRTAEKACSAIPGLGVAGVDVLVPDLRSAIGAKVIELNASANSAINQYPAFGQGRAVTAEIVGAMIRQYGYSHD